MSAFILVLPINNGKSAPIGELLSTRLSTYTPRACPRTPHALVHVHHTRRSGVMWARFTGCISASCRARHSPPSALREAYFVACPSGPESCRCWEAAELGMVAWLRWSQEYAAFEMHHLLRCVFLYASGTWHTHLFFVNVQCSTTTTLVCTPTMR